jgi:methionyl-tRNA formyltransferase
MAGDDETGVTIMQMEEGLDTGPMLLTARLPIGPRTTGHELRNRLADLGAQLLPPALDGLAAGTLIARPQPADGITYAKKLSRDQGRIDWTRPAAVLERAVRALSPQPGVFLEHAGERIKVLAADLADGSGAPGTVLDERLTVACGQGALRPLLLQRPGRGATEVAAFLRGYPLPPGTPLG